eukprot:1179194-Prorocentrum_minimum.AAC.1
MDSASPLRGSNVEERLRLLEARLIGPLPTKNEHSKGAYPGMPFLDSSLAYVLSDALSLFGVYRVCTTCIHDSALLSVGWLHIFRRVVRKQFDACFQVFEYGTTKAEMSGALVGAWRWYQEHALVAEEISRPGGEAGGASEFGNVPDGSPMSLLSAPGRSRSQMTNEEHPHNSPLSNGHITKLVSVLSSSSNVLLTSFLSRVSLRGPRHPTEQTAIKRCAKWAQRRRRICRRNLERGEELDMDWTWAGRGRLT